MIAPGSVVAGYRVRRVIGSGGMGTIYAVDDPQLPRLDALKLLSAELSADAKFRARFTREADIAAGLDHPNIVSIYDRGETPDGQLWIAMQLVDGTDADAAIRAGTMNPRRAVHIVAAVAEALDYAHSRQVLHRDVKPANFLLAGPAGEEERVLLGDFGIARAIDDAGLTGTNMVMATMAYAAPEVLSGQHIDYRADLYSLGCALFHLLTGQVPYADTTGASAQAMAHLQRPPPQVSTLVPGMPADFDAVIATAMAKDPDQRFQSGRALASAARDALRHRDHTTDPVTQPHTGPAVGPGSGQQARRNRGKLLAALAAVGVIAVGGITAAVLHAGNRGSSTRPTVTSQPPTDTVPPVAGADLASLMVPTERIGAIIGTPVRTVDEPLTRFLTMDSEKCSGVAMPFQRGDYQSSGSTDQLATMYAKTSVTDGTRAVFAGVVAFPTADLADKFVARQRVLWPSCAFQVVTFTSDPGQPDSTWRIGAVDATDSVLTADLVSQQSGSPCQHALASANNVVIDVLACSSKNKEPAAEITRAVADLVPH